MRSRTIAVVCAILLVALPAASQQSRGKAEATIKGKRVTIDYGRPALQGRDMLGMAQTGMVWRLGMDDATEIKSTGALVVAGKDLKPGSYTLWAKKTGANQWTLAFHPMTGVWGDPPLESGYVAQMPLRFEKVPNSAEQLTISVADKAGDAAITIRWGTAQLTGTFGIK